MADGGLHNHRWPCSEPVVDNIKRVAGAKGLRKERRKRGDAHKRQQNYPREPDRLMATERLLQPTPGAAVLGHALVNGVNQHIGVDDDQWLLAERQLVHQFLIFQGSRDLQRLVVVYLRAPARSKGPLAERPL